MNAPADGAWNGFSSRRNLMYAFTLPDAPPTRGSKTPHGRTQRPKSSPETDGS